MRGQNLSTNQQTRQIYQQSIPKRDPIPCWARPAELQAPDPCPKQSAASAAVVGTSILQLEGRLGKSALKASDPACRCPAGRTCSVDRPEPTEPSGARPGTGPQSQAQPAESGSAPPGGCRTARAVDRRMRFPTGATKV